MPIACDLAEWYFLYCCIDGIEPPLSLIRSCHLHIRDRSSTKESKEANRSLRISAISAARIGRYNNIFQYIHTSAHSENRTALPPPECFKLYNFELHQSERMSLADYLAKNYLTADLKSEKKPKKRKRNDGAHAGLIIADDDALVWKSNGNIGDNEDGPLTGSFLSAC